MFRYYQPSEKSKWLPIPDSDKVQDAAIEAGAKKLTILAVSEIITDETNKEKLSYKGPMYFDIDSKDISEAINSTKKLVSKLQDVGVPDDAINLYASGSKGFHIIIQASVFSSARPLRNLPYIYMELALEFFVVGMDFQVYSGSRGNSWKIENVQRDDGNYRVPLTLGELGELENREQYEKLVSAPRAVIKRGLSGRSSTGMATLFESAKKRFKMRPRTIAVIEDSALEQFKETPPHCVQMVASYDVKNATKFNEAGMQMAIYLARSGSPQRVIDSLLDRMAEKGHSTKYNSSRSRLEHLKGLVGYFGKKSSKFSCNAMRGICISSPCESCKLEEVSDTSSTEDSGYDVVENSDGYYIDGERGAKKICNFVLHPVAVYVVKSQSGSNDRRVGTMVDMVRNERVMATFMFEESGWSSRSSFNSQCTGVTDEAFVGSDLDVQKIKNLVLKEGREMGEVAQVFTAGVHMHKIGNKDIRVYVEPGMSVNQMKVQGTHHLQGTVKTPPRITGVQLPKVGDEEVGRAVESLLNINSAETMSQVIGWFAASHLKVHFMRRYQQFPLLCLWGNAGSGKTMTAVISAHLSGCDYALDDSPVLLASITNFAMIDYCSGTTTAPRLLDEYNKSKMTRKMYDFCGEIMKSAWNGQTVARGTISGSKANGSGRTGAHVNSIPISSPLVIMSEQAPEMPALQQRSVQVMIKKGDREGCTGDFIYADRHRDELRSMAKAMIIAALSTDIEWVEDSMDAADKLIPSDITDRARHTYQALMVGLDFLRHVCVDLQLEVTDKVDELKSALVKHLDGEGAAILLAKQRTEVDSVMEEIGIMIAVTKSDSELWLVEGKHYITDRDRNLYLDLPIVHAGYKKYVR
ncbi:hypothetical protein KAT92_05965, partial [Candidatus Babeliales bacterium]|nr:hypothetical protein [Candidatus Babeliales bacterium]